MFNCMLIAIRTTVGGGGGEVFIILMPHLAQDFVTKRQRV